MGRRGTDLLDDLLGRAAAVASTIVELERDRQALDMRLRELRSIHSELLASADALNRLRLEDSLSALADPRSDNHQPRLIGDQRHSH